MGEKCVYTDEKIETYVTLLDAMKERGDEILVEKPITKTYADSAKYLSELVSYEDKIKKPNASLQSDIEGKLKKIMNDSGQKKEVVNKVVAENTKLLVSYIMLQAEKTKVLNALVKHMDEQGPDLLLRHGSALKSMQDGADVLRGKTTDEIQQTKTKGSPVMVRKIQLRLENLVQQKQIKEGREHLEDVIKEASNYLALNVLQSKTIKICKCMKNALVQCEVCCDEALRRLPKSCCPCACKYDKAKLMPGEGISPQNVKITECPASSRHVKKPAEGVCPAPIKSEDCGQKTSNNHTNGPQVHHTLWMISTENNFCRYPTTGLSPKTSTLMICRSIPSFFSLPFQLDLD